MSAENGIEYAPTELHHNGVKYWLLHNQKGVVYKSVSPRDIDEFYAFPDCDLSEDCIKGMCDHPIVRVEDHVFNYFYKEVKRPHDPDNTRIVIIGVGL